MIYVKRNDHNKIIDLVFTPKEDYEEISIHSKELTDFIDNSDASRELIQEILNRLDLKMIRVIEDVVQVLISKNVMRVTDFPEEVQNQLLFKRRVRSMNEKHQSIINDEEDDLIML